MRTPVLAAVLVALAAPLLASFATADDVCVPMCTVPSTTAAFVPPVTVVLSGSTVTWTADDGLPHTSTAAASTPCFHVAYGKLHPGKATFRVEDGALLASVGTKEKACPEAGPLPDGGFALRYVCLYHAQMVGEIVVRPA